MARHRLDPGARLCYITPTCPGCVILDLRRDPGELLGKAVTPDTVVAFPAGAAPLIPETERDLTAARMQGEYRLYLH